MVDGAYAEFEAGGLAEDLPVGIRAKKSPEAIALILACLRAQRPFLLPSIELAADTLAKLFAQGGRATCSRRTGREATARRACGRSCRTLERTIRRPHSGRRRAVVTTSRSC